MKLKESVPDKYSRLESEYSERIDELSSTKGRLNSLMSENEKLKNENMSLNESLKLVSREPLLWEEEKKQLVASL